MYTLITNNGNKKLTKDELAQECFTLKCQGEPFVVIYPSGYMGTFEKLNVTIEAKG